MSPRRPSVPRAPRPLGPRTADSRTTGTRTAGSRTAGPRAAGSRTAGSRTAGSRAAGPRPLGPERSDTAPAEAAQPDRPDPDPRSTPSPAQPAHAASAEEPARRTVRDLREHSRYRDARTVTVPDVHDSAVTSGHSDVPTRASGRVVRTADRRLPLQSQPWERRRRRTQWGVLAALLLVLAGIGAVFLPALRVDSITVSALTHVDETAVREAAAPALGQPILLVRSATLEDDIARMTGVESVEVGRELPSALTVDVVEAAPAATVNTPDGARVVDREGEPLALGPGEVAEDLPSVTVTAGSQDVQGATEEMLAVIGQLPPELRDQIADMRASSRNDITVTVTTADGASKTVIWGGQDDSGLKAQVVAALLGEPGDVIDVSSPHAPVTR